MGFNWGAFAGAAAKSGVDTYVTMTDIQRKEREMQLKEEEANRQAQTFAQQKAEWEKGQKLDEIFARTMGAPSEKTDVAYGVPNAQGKVEDYTGADYAAVAPTVTTTPYSRERKIADFQQKAAAAGIGPTRVQQALKGELELGGLQRSERYAVQQETALGFQQQVLSDLTKNKGDVGAVLEKHFVPLYNENKLPGLNDGGTAKVVSDAMGGGKTVVITDKAGKQTTLPANLDTLQMLTSKAQDLMMASSSPENYWKHKEQFIKERTVVAHEKQADAAVESARAAVMNAKTNQQAEGAKSRYYDALAKRAGMTVTDIKLEEIKANATIMMRADPKLTQEAADLKAAQIVFKSPELKENVVTPDQINTFIQNNPDLMQKKGKSGKMEPLTSDERTDLAYKALSRGSRGAGGASTTPTGAALNSLLANPAGVDPFAKPSAEPPGAVDTDRVPPLPSSALPTKTGPTRYGNIDPAMQDKLYSNVTALDQQIQAAETALRNQPNMQNAQALRVLREERAKLAANPLLR